MQVSIFWLCQQVEFVGNLHRLVRCCEPECPELERQQAVHHQETEHRPDTQGDKVPRTGLGKEEQANTRDCSQKFEACQGGDTAGALIAQCFHMYSLFDGCTFIIYIRSECPRTRSQLASPVLLRAAG